MKLSICPISPDLLQKLPEHTGDRSGVGVHYVDAYIKAMNVTLPDGRVVTCKRKGLKILLSLGERKGEGLLRRVAHGDDPVILLRKALEEATAQAGLAFSEEGGHVQLEEPAAQ